jgi:hypothetical protein
LPSLDAAIADDGAGSLVRVDLLQHALAAGRRFASCMSPVTSPAGRFVVCRDRRAGVLRVPVAGGSLDRVFRWPGRVHEGPQGAVEFVSPTEMRVGADITGDWGTFETVAWHE